MSAVKRLETGEATAAKYAARAMAAANNKLTDEQCRSLFLACTSLTQKARAAEHNAYMMLSEQLQGQPAGAADFNDGTRKLLKEVHEQLKLIGRLLNGETVEG